MFAFAARLECLEFVHGLKELPVLGGLVAHDLFEILVGWQDAGPPAGLNALRRNFREDAFGDRAVCVSLRDLKVILCFVHVGCDALDLVALDTPTAP